MQWLEDSKYPLDWNGPANRPFTEFRDEDLDCPIIHHFKSIAERFPTRIAVTDSETSLTFAELWNGISGLAERLQAETKPGDLIGILLPVSSLFPVAMLACLAAGRPFLAIDPHYPEDWLRQVLEDARPSLIVRQGDVVTALKTVHEDWRPVEFHVDQPACMLFTSGSTGRPKRIVNSQRALLQRVAQSINAAHINAEDRFLTLASLCTIVGVRDTLTALLAGARLHFLDPHRSGAREILNVIREQRITILFAFPALLRSVVPYAEEPAPDAMRLVRVGGDTTLWSDIDLLRGWLTADAKIQSIYAATEAPMMQWFVDDSLRTSESRIPIGYPLPGNRLAVTEDGELIVSSSYVALELGGQFRTGDLVRQRADGLLERLGRKDRQIKIRGARVDLDGVEAALRKHPHVRDVGVMARTSSSDGESTLVAYLAAQHGAGDELAAKLLDDVKEMMRALPPSMRPARFYLTPAIPRLPSSKLDLRALAALDAATVETERASVAKDVEGASPYGDSIAQKAAQVWQRVLEMTVHSIEDDFFDAGGDSLKAITFVMELERALNLELPLTLITEAPTFGRLCDALRGHQTKNCSVLVPLKSGADLPPVFFIHGVGGSVAGLFQMARRMNYSGPVIGIQARGLAGETPHASVEEMAAEYLKEIKTRQPKGPYYLCGYSFGGLVAFEMARRLRESGEEVGLVGLFDTITSPRRWSLRYRLSVVPQRIIQFASAVSAAPIHTWPAAVWKMVSVLKVAMSALIASSRYRPGFYPGELTLFTPAGREPGRPSLQSIWSKHARALSVVETAGTHSTMLSASNADFAAACLTRRLSRLADFA